MRLFYKEAQQLAKKTSTTEREITIVTIKKEETSDFDLNVIRIQRALRKSYEEGYQKGWEDGIKHRDDPRFC